MYYTTLFGIAAGIVTFFAYAVYLVSVVHGKTRPNRTSWWLWTFVGVMIATSYYTTGARHTIWVPVIYVVGPLVGAILSYKYGEGGTEPLDKFCFFISAISLPIWIISGSPLIALIINIFIDFLAVILTVLKSYARPWGEDWRAWVLFFIGSLMNIFAIGSWSLLSSFHPVYILFTNGLILCILLFSLAKLGKIKTDNFKVVGSYL